MSEREWAVFVIDPAPGAKLRIEPAGNRQRAEARVEHYRRTAATGQVVWRYTFMPEMPWTALDGRTIRL